MEKLKVGDKLYLKQHARWGDDIYYQFASVERLTKTQAVLSNGVKLINEPSKDYYSKEIGYSVYGDRWTKWYFQNEQILIEAKVEKEKRLIDNWFSKRKFTNEEKKIIYLKFQELNLLES